MQTTGLHWRFGVLILAGILVYKQWEICDKAGGRNCFGKESYEKLCGGLSASGVWRNKGSDIG